MIRYIIGFIAIGAVLALIFIQASSSYNVENRTSNVLAREIHDWIIDQRGVEERSVSEVELIIRKLAHLLEYFLLGTVVYLSMIRLFPNRWAALLFILLVTLPVPYIDEFVIQAKADGRSVQLLDLMIDYVGIALALMVGGVYSLLGKVNTH